MSDSRYTGKNNSNVTRICEGKTRNNYIEACQEMHIEYYNFSFNFSYKLRRVCTCMKREHYKLYRPYKSNRIYVQVCENLFV
jgi:hypothetical protein